jgi:hypothetical protein
VKILTEANIARVIELRSSGASWKEIGDDLDVPRQTARSAWRRHNSNKASGAINARAKVKGIMPDSDLIDPDELWQEVIGKQEKRAAKIIRQRVSQRVIIPDKLPFAMAFLSDLHLGSADTDYQTVRRDAEIIRDTPGLYAIFTGDGLNNWIVSKLQRLQRDEILPFDSELQLLANWLEIISGKLRAVCSGNHENWTKALAGIDIIRENLRGVKCLYDPNEVVFDLVWGNNSTVFKVRHSWRFSSIYNATHGIETGWERGGVKFDIGIGAHTHIATVCRPFYRHGKKRLAVLTGTYKLDDPFGREIGAAPSQGRGCGALLFYPDGRTLFFDELETCADFLTWLRKK